VPIIISSKKSDFKIQIIFNNQITMKEKRFNNFDLEERTFKFAKDISIFIKDLLRNTSNIEYSKQLVRSSASVGANYIEANESLSKKDFLMRVKISRKEAKESAYWLRLIMNTNKEIVKERVVLLYNEAIELKKILSQIIINTEKGKD